MRENEKIKKGLKNLEKNEEKNMINEKFEIRIYRRRK